MDPSSDLILTPVVQYGFAGFCVLQFGFIVWLTYRLLKIIEQNNTVIADWKSVIDEHNSLIRDFVIRRLEPK